MPFGWLECSGTGGLTDFTLGGKEAETKLIEVFGINEPLLCLKIARGEEVEDIKNYPVGILFLDPIEDLMGLGLKLLDLLIYKFRIGIQKKAAVDRFNQPMALSELAQCYRQTYFTGRRKMFNPYFKYLFHDPLVSILWWIQYSTLVLRAAKELGR